MSESYVSIEIHVRHIVISFKPKLVFKILRLSQALEASEVCLSVGITVGLKIKCSSTNHVNGNFLLSEGLPTKFSLFSIFEIFVQPSNFFVSKGLI